MAFKLGDFLRGAVAQINPFDNGQTFASVQEAARKKSPPPASTARPNQVALTNQINSMAKLGPVAVNAPRSKDTSTYVNPIKAVTDTRIPAMGNYTVGKAYNDLIQKPVIDPVLEGGRQLTDYANGKPVDTGKFLANTAITGLNAASFGRGVALLNGGESLLKRVGMGALEQGGFGAALGTAQTARDNGTPADYLANAGAGALTGAAVGGAIPIVGSAVKLAARGIGNGIDALSAANKALGEKGFISAPFPKIEKPINPALPPQVQATIREAQDQVQALHMQVAQHQDAIDYAKELINSNKSISTAQRQAAIKEAYKANTAAVNATKQELSGWLEHIAELDPSGTSVPVRAAQETGVPLDTPMSYDKQPSKLQKFGSMVKQTLASDRGSIDFNAKIGGQAEPPKNPFNYGSMRYDLFERAAKDPSVDLGREAYDWRSNNANGFMADKTLEKATADVKAALKGQAEPQPSPLKPRQSTLESVPKSAGSSSPIIAENKFTKSVKGSPEVSTEVKGMVSGQHTVRNTKQLMQESRAAIASEGLPKATDNVLSELAVKSGEASDATLAKALEVAKAHDALGTEAGQNMAASIYDQISEHGVAQGQRVQILSQLARSSPAGLRNKAFRDLKKAGVELTDSLKKEIQGQIDAISKMPEGKARDFAVAVLQKTVAKHLPQSKIGNAISVWKAGLLSGVKTQGGNFVSNATFGTLKSISDPLASVLDEVASIGTGVRTKAYTNKGKLSGAVQGVKEAVSTLKTGIDTRNIGDKYEQHAEINFGNKALHKALQKIFGDPTNMVFRAMSASDQPFWYSSLKNSLYDQAKADGLNANLSGKALRKHMDELVANPTDKMVEIATKDANKATLAFDTLASKAISGIRKGIDNSSFSDAGKATAKAALDILAPFTKVPSAFLSRVVDFTPLGVGKEVFSQIAKKQFDQRSLVQAISEGVTGTGVVALGISLAKSGQLSGDYPKADAKEQARWKAEGITANSVKLGDKWYSLNYMGPLGLLFNAGNKIAETEKGGGDSTAQAGAALAGLGQGLLGQSFLQGMSGFSDAVNNPAQNAKSYINSMAASTIPSWLNDIGNLTDQYQRQANTPVEAMKGRLPWERQNLMPKIDSFGNDLKQPVSGLNTALNPLKPSTDTHTPLLNELDRLKSTGRDNVVFPTIAKTIDVGAETIKLTPEQSTERQKLLGNQLTPLWESITTSPAYAKLTDDQKATALQTALKDINGAVNRTMINKIDSAKLDKPATGNVAQILMGKVPSAEAYITKASKSGVATPTNPTERYQANLAAYNAAKAAGTLTPVQDYKKQQSLAREAITSQYSSDVITFYGLSKAQQTAYFKTNPTEAKKLYDQAKQLDSQLTSKVGTTSKFKSTGKSAKAKKGKYNYASRLSVKKSSTGALRRLIASSKIKSKKVSAKA